MNTQNVKVTENGFKSRDTNFCPFIGMYDDPSTAASYPSLANACFRIEKGQTVSQLHQHEFCLAQAYDSCPTFRQANIPVADVDVAPVEDSYFETKRPLMVAAVLALLLLVFVIAYALFPQLGSQKTIAAAPMVANESSPAEIEQDDTEGIQLSSTLISRKQLPVVGLPNDGATATAAVVLLSKAKLTTSTPTATATTEPTAVSQPTNTAQPTATKVPPATATPEPQPPASNDENINDENIIDENIVYTYGSGIIDIGKLNVRRGPDPQFNIITTVSKGQIITLTGRNSDSSWARTRLDNGVVGWVYAEYIIAEPPLERLPFIPRSQR